MTTGVLPGRRVAPAAEPATGTWEAWIGVLETAVADYATQLQAHREAAPAEAVAPVFTPAPTPDGALPAVLVGRARAALDGLEQLTLHTQERRDALAGQLAALSRSPRRRAGAYREHELGGSFDARG
jgi:hypothetical protein